MLTDDDKINGLPVRAEIRVPHGSTDRWITSYVICPAYRCRFTVWAVYRYAGQISAEHGRYFPMSAEGYAAALNNLNERAMPLITD